MRALFAGNSGMTSAKTMQGRAETLSAEQERVLKDVWMYILHYAGMSVSPPGPQLRSRKNSQASHHAPAAAVEKKKLGGLLGKLKKGKKDKENEDHAHGHHGDLKRTLSGQSGIDPNVKHSTDVKIHEALKSLDSDKIINAFWDALRHDSPDNLLLRFIRARKWDVDHSLMMIANTLDWRMNQSRVDELLKSSELGCLENKEDGVLIQFRKGKCIIRGKDKRGRPIVIVRPRFHFSSDQTSKEVEHFTLLLIEYARLLLTEPVDQCVLIFDLSGFTMANMDYDPVKYIIGAFEAHYPESLGVLLIHKAPWIFSGIWAIVKKWLDPVVASKINFTKSVEDMEKWISKDQILKEMGGEDDYDWEYLEPNSKDNGLKEVDEAKFKQVKEQREKLLDEFTQKTIQWIESKTPEESKALHNERLSISKKLSENYTIYDGFVRNRGIYDRLGYVTFQ